MVKAAFFKLPLSIAAMALAGTMLTGCGPHPDTHPGQPVTKRKIIFRSMLRSFEPLGMVIRGRADYDRATFLKHAIDLDGLAKQPWSYFGPGSYYTPTRARQTVWQFPARFKTRQQQLMEATGVLARVSQAGNLDAIRPAYERVVQACNNCHNEFRYSGL